MNILIFNWKDIKNPTGGGAEILTHELAKRWVKKGNTVTWYTSTFTGARSKEFIDGIEIIRKGQPYGIDVFNYIQVHAFLLYKKIFKGKYDVVLDEIHGIPFFTPLYIKEKKIALICEVAGDLWMKVFPIPIGLIGKIVENFYLHYLYNSVHFLTISESTKKELLLHGIKKKNISVIPMGVSFPETIEAYKKEKSPTLIFVGRLAKQKGIEDSLIVIKILKEKYPTIKLWVVGRGEKTYVSYLNKLIFSFGIDKNIEFLGFVSQREKFKRLGKAHILIAPSIKEGFGLTVPEAGWVNTPAIVYNVPGLSELVVSGETGYITKVKSPVAIAENVVKLLNNKSLYTSMQTKAREESKKYSWDKSAEVTLTLMKKYGIY